MVKSEHLRRLEEFTRISPAPLTTPSSSTGQKFSTKPTINPYFIDSSAIDISSIKGRFAWEKITLSDTYMPVIFRGTTKIFCVKMVLKLLADYPDDILYRASHYRYWQKIDIFKATSNEINLLNRINSQHCHWSYSRQPFGTFTELVCVADFLPFLEHLLLYYKKQSTKSASSMDLPQAITSQSETGRQAPTNTLDHQIPRSSIDMAVSSHVQFLTESSSQQDSIMEKLLAAKLSKKLSQSAQASKPVARPSASPKRKPSQTSTMASQPVATSKFQRLPLEPSSISATNPIEIASCTNHSSHTWNKKPRISILTAALTGSTSSVQSSLSRLESFNAFHSLSKSPDRTPSLPSESFLQTSTNAPVTGATEAITPAENSVTTSTTVAPALAATNEPLTSKSPTLHSGWLQINKLYTPYVSITSENHHHYRIPINLLTFYQLLPIGTSEIHTNETKDSSFFTPSEQNLATPQEIEVINSLCFQQNIKPFTNDTALIDLATFYQYCTVNSLFIKELPTSDPKGSICKNWTSVNKTNGGLCRLRNITTLQEQTLPVIGNSILNNLSLSLQTLATASTIIPNDTEIEFLRLMIFFINQPVSLTNPQLIDIEAVKREYTVDLILLFNDKFPINVLNYQQQESRINTQPASIIRSNSSATNTIAESTPPPSPPSPTTNSTQPAASTATESPSPSRPASTSSSLTQSNPSNRFHKTIIFRGHSLIAYICSGLDMTTQRECISIRDLCHVLYPESTTMDKIEKKMFRLLRTKNINRFRPQNQEPGSITRLVDIKDIETHWEFIEQELSRVSKAELPPVETKPILVPITSDEATTSEMLEEDVKKFEQESSISEILSDVDNHVIKRPLDDIIEDQQMENVEATVEHNDKRLRLIDLDEFGSIVSEGSDFQHLSADEYDSVTEPSTTIDVATNEKKVEQDDSSTTSTKKIDTSDNEHEEEAQPSQLKRSSIRVIRRKPTQETLLKIKQNSITKATQATSTNIPKKRIFFSKTRKRIGKNVLKPCTRANQQLPAAWVHKYNIEECWVHLDLYVAPDRDDRH